eukprot:2904999-Amphidinium_carterae.1
MSSRTISQEQNFAGAIPDALGTLAKLREWSKHKVESIERFPPSHVALGRQLAEQRNELLWWTS